MGRDKKWASNDKDKLLVENWKKFMEEGDFSPDEDLNERSWGQMGKDVMKGDFMGHGRMGDAKSFANGMIKRAYKLVRSGEYDDLDTALTYVAGHMADRDSREEIYAAKKAAGDEFKTMDDLTFIQVLGAKVYKKFGGTLSREAEEARAASMDNEKRMKKKDKHNDELEQRRKKDQRSAPDDDDYEEEEEDPHARSFGITRDITPGNKDYEKERRATTGRWDEAKKRNKWSSNDKNQLLVENFRNFMEEGDFSPNSEEKSQATGRLAPDAARPEIVAHALSRILGTQPSGMSLEGLESALPQVLDEMGVDVKRNIGFLRTVAFGAEEGKTYPALEQDGTVHQFEVINVGTYSPDGSQRTGTAKGLKLVTER